MYKVNTANKQETKSVLTSTGLKDMTSVRRTSSRSSSSKNSVLLNTKNHSEDVEVHRAIFTTPRTAKSKSLDTTYVVAKTRFVVVTPLSAKTKDSSALRSTLLFAQEISLSKYTRTKINTSRKWKKWYETQPNVGWSPKSLTANANPSVVKSRDHVVSYSNKSVTIRKWVAKPSTLPSVFSSCDADDLDCLVDFRFGNDHFVAITGYVDYVHDNVTICHVYYVKGLGHNLFSVGQLCDGDLEVAFRSKTCYVRNLEGDDLLTGARESNLYTISISDMAASSPGKRKKATFPPKLVPITHSELELIHVDLCEPMRVYFLQTKDEAPEMIKKFIAQIQLNSKLKFGKLGLTMELNSRMQHFRLIMKS
ncbi:hypothetical protein Tco_0518899 [Tanacetum coccineum]